MSTVKANDLTNVTGGIPTVKSQHLIPTAWVNFNGTGTVAIRDSENVSSITDVAVGLYSITFATAMANTNYSVSGSVVGSTNALYYSFISPRGVALSTTQVPFSIMHNNGTLNDQEAVSLIILGGQA